MQNIGKVRRILLKSPLLALTLRSVVCSCQHLCSDCFKNGASSMAASRQRYPKDGSSQWGILIFHNSANNHFQKRKNQWSCIFFICMQQNLHRVTRIWQEVNNLQLLRFIVSNCNAEELKGFSRSKVGRLKVFHYSSWYNLLSSFLFPYKITTESQNCDSIISSFSPCDAQTTLPIYTTGTVHLIGLYHN